MTQTHDLNLFAVKLALKYLQFLFKLYTFLFGTLHEVSLLLRILRFLLLEYSFQMLILFVQIVSLLLDHIIIMLQIFSGSLVIRNKSLQLRSQLFNGIIFFWHDFVELFLMLLIRIIKQFLMSFLLNFHLLLQRLLFWWICRLDISYFLLISLHLPASLLCDSILNLLQLLL